MKGAVVEYLTDETEGAIPLCPVRKKGFSAWAEAQPSSLRAWMSATGFSGGVNELCFEPGAKGKLKRVLAGVNGTDPWSWASLPGRLPVGTYVLEGSLGEDADPDWIAFAWMMGTYVFERYRSGDPHDFPLLVWPHGADRAAVTRRVQATRMVRDLITMPSSHMGPEELAGAAEDLGNRHGARCRVIVGDALLHENYPLIHAVGRASERPPRLVDLRWGDPLAPKVTLVGKGVCFDSGGLDMKSASNMKLMKKDMGGAAHVLGLAHMIMDAALPVRLRVLIPAVENSVSGRALRPLDVVTSRKGLTVEIGNTDAEGRLVMADALTEACSEEPALLLDIATLTGAARVALGTDIAAMFSNDDALAAEIEAQGHATHDPVWRLPLWKGYRRQLDSKVADLNNVSESPYAGAITAALFLQEFVTPATPWAHFDIMAWNSSSRSGRPEGGEALTLRALFEVIARRFPG